MNQSLLVTLLRSARLPFLVLTPVSIFLGYASSAMSADEVSMTGLLLVLIGALAAHISVNAFNEYFDFHSGLDAKTSRTPFSGGSGALVEHPSKARAVLAMAIVGLLVSIIVGVYFVVESTPLLLPIGALGILIVVSYTQWLNRHPVLCLLAPGLGFGPLMVIGTSLALTGACTGTAVLVSLVPLFLASNLLLLNQYPDIDADTRAGRRHVPIVYGTRFSTLLYGVLAASAGLVIVAGVQTTALPSMSYAALLPLALTSLVFFGALRHAGSIRKLVPFMGLNVLATIITPLLLGLGLILG